LERRTDKQAAADSGERARFDFGRVWMVAAYVLFAGAAVLLYMGRPQAAFLVAVLGASAWFLHVRATLIRKHDLVKVGRRDWRPRREVERESADDAEEE
jgi:hypothetical protein